MEITVTKSDDTWIHTMSSLTFDDKWDAFDDARKSYPNATIKMEGVGIFSGGTFRDSDSQVSRFGGKTASTERHS